MSIRYPILFIINAQNLFKIYIQFLVFSVHLRSLIRRVIVETVKKIVSKYIFFITTNYFNNWIILSLILFSGSFRTLIVLKKSSISNIFSWSLMASKLFFCLEIRKDFASSSATNTYITHLLTFSIPSLFGQTDLILEYS
jgi:hypothetical protein